MDRHGGERWVGAGARTAGLLAGALLAGLWMGACAPRAEDGGCSEDDPCTSRGQVCDLETFECVAAEVDTSAAENPAPASFTDKIITFHRGEVCLPHEVKSGERIPLLMRPCLHPCVMVGSYQFKHAFECRGSHCTAEAFMWVTGTSAPTGCPTDAFGSFDQAQCQYGTQVELQVATETSSGPISGDMLLELPFLTNEDAATLAADPDDTETVEALVQQYPQQPNRIPDGRAISILPGNPAPPATCVDGGCPCYPIGF
jgi:hypothetical protein